MAMTKPFDTTVLNRAKASKTFRCAILESAMNELMHGDLKVAKILINHYVNSIIDQQDLTTNSKSARLQVLLEDKNNLTAQGLVALLREIQHDEGVKIITKIHNK